MAATRRAQSKRKRKMNEEIRKSYKFASFAFADKNNGTKDIFISIILIMTPESKQRQDTLPADSSPRLRPKMRSRTAAIDAVAVAVAAHNKTKVLISSLKLCNVKLMRR